MLVKSKKYINVDVDTRMIAIQSQKAEEERVEEKQPDCFYIPNLDNRNVKNISIRFAMEILT